MKVQCKECKNDKELKADDVQKGRWFECDYCGTTYEITSIKENGEPEVQMIEEEK